MSFMTESNLWHRLFAQHPAAVRESYLQHFLAAGRISWRLLGMCLACLCHAIVPGLFENTASRGVVALAGELSRRRCCDTEGGAGI